MSEIKPKVLMIGPGRKVMGGVTTVVNSYYLMGLDNLISLTYLPTMKDGNKIIKLFTAIIAYIKLSFSLCRYDIIHVHMAAQASFDRKAFFIKKAKTKNKKIIIHQHAADFDDYYFNQSNEKKRQKIKKVFAMANSLIVLSEEWKKFYTENIYDINKTIVLNNGVKIPEYNKTDYRNKNVLFLGKLGNRKGSYDLIKAIPDVIKEIPDVMFYLGGNGDIDESYKIIKSKNLEKNVKILGWVNDKDKEELLKKCSIFILPSYHEGMPMSVLEAMSYGLAAISTNAGGIPQIIENNVNGIRIKAGDIEAITNTLISLLTDVELKEKLGKNGKNTIEKKFNIENNITALIKIYKKLSE